MSARRVPGDAPTSRLRTRAFLTALAIAALALPGALPGSRGAPDPVALLVWLACVAASAGALAGGARLPLWPYAAAVPGTWAILFALVCASAPRDIPSPLAAAVAASGLFCAGFALGRAGAPQVGRAHAAGLLALAVALVLAPVAGAYLRAPWPGAVTALLLDLSPATLLAECAGVDWLRHPAVYDAAGSADLDPALRGAYAPRLAAGIVLVLGCAGAVLAERIVRRPAKAL